MNAKLVKIMFSLFGITFSALAAGHACFTAKVVDEESKPMPNVPVSAAFLGISINSVVQEGILVEQEAFLKTIQEKQGGE